MHCFRYGGGALGAPRDMGADFLLYTLPACNFDEERVAELEKLIDGLPEEELPEDYYNDPPEPRQLLKDMLEDYLERLHGRETTVLCFEGWPYPMCFSGGMSWGDKPTEIAESMSILLDCDPVWNKLEEWAQADKAAADCPSRTNAITIGIKLDDERT